MKYVNAYKSFEKGCFDTYDINVPTVVLYPLMLTNPFCLLPLDELELSEVGGGSKVVAGRDLKTDTMWGPYPGILQSEGSTEDPDTEVRPPLTSSKESVMVTEAEPLSLCINPYTHGNDALPE